MKDEQNKTEEKKEEGQKEIDRYEKIVDRAQKEITGVRYIYMWLAAVLGIVIAGGGYVTWSSFGSFRTEMKADMEAEAKLIKSRINLEVDILQRQVKSRIDEEFKKEKIQSLIEQKAKEHTEKAAQQYITEQINAVITPFKTEIQNTRAEANLELQRLKDLFTVYDTADQAMAGSKNAYIKLKSLTADKETDIRIAARARLVEIDRYLDIYRDAPKLFSPLSATRHGVRTSFDKITLDEIVTMMLGQPSLRDAYRHTCMVYIQKKAKKEVFEAALRVFASDSLPTCAAFCGVLSKVSDKKAEFLDFDGWTKICQKQLKR